MGTVATKMESRKKVKGFTEKMKSLTFSENRVCCLEDVNSHGKT